MGAAIATRPGPHPAMRVLDYFLLYLRRTFRGVIFASFLSPLLYLVAMGYGLGSLVNAGANLGGVTYVQFIAPGMLVASAMQNGVFQASYPVLGAIKWQRQFHAMLATPLGVRDVVIGNLAAIVLGTTVPAVVFLVVATVLGAILSIWAVVALLAVVLVTLACAAPMFALSACSQNDARFTIVFRVVLIPMFLFSGTFFPVEQLPDWLQPATAAVPLWHACELARDATLGRLELVSASGHVVYLLLWALGGGWLAVRSLRRRMVV